VWPLPRHDRSRRRVAERDHTKANLIVPDEVQRLSQTEALAPIGELHPPGSRGGATSTIPTRGGIEGPMPSLGPDRSMGHTATRRRLPCAAQP